MSATESTQSSVPIYQVKWFSKKTGFDLFELLVAKISSFIIQIFQSDGFRYLKEGELITWRGNNFGDGKTKISNISSHGGWSAYKNESSARRRPRAPDEEENVPSSE